MAAWILNGDDPRLPDLWEGSADLTPGALELVLEAAREQVQEFGPELDNPDAPPARWVMAQALQAKSLTAAGWRGDQAQNGLDGAPVVFPMDWQVKNLIRPQRGGKLVVR